MWKRGQEGIWMALRQIRSSRVTLAGLPNGIQAGCVKMIDKSVFWVGAGRRIKTVITVPVCELNKVYVERNQKGIIYDNCNYNCSLYSWFYMWLF